MTLDDMLSLLLFILLLGVTVYYSMQFLNPMSDMRRWGFGVYMDKTASSLDGEWVDAVSSDGYLNELEVVLMTQIIDASMPEPRAMSFGAEVFDVDVEFRSNFAVFAVGAYGHMKPNGANARYFFKYDWGLEDVVGDESYRLELGN